MGFYVGATPVSPMLADLRGCKWMLCELRGFLIEAALAKEVTNESHFGCARNQDCPVSRPAGTINLRA